IKDFSLCIRQNADFIKTGRTIMIKQDLAKICFNCNSFHLKSLIWCLQDRLFFNGFVKCKSKHWDKRADLKWHLYEQYDTLDAALEEVKQDPNGCFWG
ncbi:MAG: DUF3024 domain-containing protein, partial [Candidatus Omnitrophica bacterium]|nr:DUF3024 domain-containing protein [Candidatus Omnitrophota bacterium]